MQFLAFGKNHVHIRRLGYQWRAWWCHNSVIAIQLAIQIGCCLFHFSCVWQEPCVKWLAEFKRQSLRIRVTPNSSLRRRASQNQNTENNTIISHRNRWTLQVGSYIHCWQNPWITREHVTSKSKKNLRVTIRDLQAANQLIVFMGAHKYDKEVRDACMFPAISQDTRKLQRTSIPSTPPYSIYGRP